jgi:H+/gluconate symporter-like permease
MAFVKFKPNFGLKSYFFYFAQSLFKTTSIRFSISNSILFKYYFFINFLLLFSTQLKPNRDTQKKTHTNFINRAQQLQQKKNSANLQTFTVILQTIIVILHTFTEILQKISKPEEEAKKKEKEKRERQQPVKEERKREGR